MTKERYSGRYNIYARWADEDTQLLFLSHRTHEEFAIWIMDAKTQIGRQLTFNQAWVGQFSWNDSRRSLAYVARLSALDDAQDENYEVFRLDLDTASTTRLTSTPGWDGMPDWAADGKHIAYQSCAGATSAIWVMDWTGQAKRRLTAGTGWAGAPKWSPDGRWIAYESTESGAYDLWIVHPDGTGARNLTADPAWDGNAVWLPDSSGLVYESDRSGNYDLWRIDLDGVRRRLTDHAGWDGVPSVSPRGDKVAYHSAAGGAYEIRVLDLAADQDICLLRRAGNVSAVNPVWNAAGTSVACESNGDIFVVAVPDRVQDAEVTRNRPGPMTSGGRTAVRPSIGGWNALRHLKLSPYGRHSYVDRYHLIGAFDFDASYEYFKPGGTLSSMPGLARGVMVTGDPVLMRQLVSVADLMLRMARDTKQGLVWEYKQDSYAGPGPWISSYAQGYAITMAVAAHALSGDDRFIKAAHAALSPYEFPMKDGGVRTDVPGGGAWYEEYAAPTYRPAYVLNGHLFALYGALDLWRATGSERAERAFRDGLRGLKTLLPEFDDGTFSFYDLYPRQESGYPLGKGKPASLYYNHVVCKQLYWLWTVTGDTDFLARVLSFLPYSRQPDPLTVVSASNSMNEERYGVSWLTEGQVRVGPQYWSGRVPVVISLDLGMERWVHGVELFGLPRRMPQRFDVHVSLDGSDWTTALRTTHAHSGNPHEVYFLERPVRARFVRIDVLEPLGDYVLLTEVAAITRLRAMQRDPCPQPAPTEGVASVSAQACHESALENGRGSFVCSEFPTFLELCLPNHSRVEAVVLKMDAGEGAAESVATDLVVQVSPDGLGWTTIGLVQGAGPIVRVPVGHECRLVRVVVLGTSSAYPLVFRQLSAEMPELHASVPSPSGPREVASSVHREEGGDAVADISVLNGDFEMVDATDPTLPAGWWRKQGSAETIRVVPRTSGTEGDLILEIKPHPGGMLWQTLAQALPMPSEDLVYVVSFDGRVAGTGTGKVSLVLRSNERDHEVLGYTAFGGPEFQRHSFTARVPSDRGAELEIWLGQSNYRNMDCTIYYDNISVQAEEQ